MSNVSRPWYKHPGRLAGVAIAVYFGAKLALLLFLSLAGRVLPAHSGRLSPGEAVEPGSPVVYFYQVGETTRHGWRRGIDYGGEELSVVCAPVLSQLHVAIAQAGIRRPWQLWTEPDYWLRLGVALTGAVLGWFTERLWARFERQGGVFLAGLSRDPSA